jgi:hypothetical protein
MDYRFVSLKITAVDEWRYKIQLCLQKWIVPRAATLPAMVASASATASTSTSSSSSSSSSSDMGGSSSSLPSSLLTSSSSSSSSSSSDMGDSSLPAADRKRKRTVLNDDQDQLITDAFLQWNQSGRAKKHTILESLVAATGLSKSSLQQRFYYRKRQKTMNEEARDDMGADDPSLEEAPEPAAFAGSVDHADARKIAKFYGRLHRQFVSQNLNLPRRQLPQPFSFDKNNKHAAARPFMRAVHCDPNVYVQYQELAWTLQLSEEEWDKLDHISGTDGGLKHMLTVWVSDGTKIDVGWDAKDKLDQLLRYISRNQSDLSKLVDDAVLEERRAVDQFRESTVQLLCGNGSSHASFAESRLALQNAKKTLSDARSMAMKSDSVIKLKRREFYYFSFLLFLFKLQVSSCCGKS